MPISTQEFMTYVAHLLSNQNGGQNIAIGYVINNNIPNITGVGMSGPIAANTVHTPIVNLLLNTRPCSNISATYDPMEACLGMAALRGVKKIYFFSGAGFQQRDLTLLPPWLAQVPPAFPTLVPLLPIPGFAAMPLAARNAAAAAMLLVGLPPPWGPVLAAAVAAPRHLVHNIPGNVPAIPLPAILLPPLAPPPGGPITPVRRRLFLSLAYALASARRFAHQGAQGHAVGCVFVDANSTILCCSLNSSAVGVNQLYHAETLGVLRMTQAGVVLNNIEVFTTLQCCHMCAGLLTTAGTGIRVHYGQVDALMQNNALTRGHRGGSETLHDDMNTGGQLHSAFGAGWQSTIRSLNSRGGHGFLTEGLHAFKRLQYELQGPDLTLWTQCRAIINGIQQGLV